MCKSQLAQVALVPDAPEFRHGTVPSDWRFGPRWIYNPRMSGPPTPHEDNTQPARSLSPCQLLVTTPTLALLVDALVEALLKRLAEVFGVGIAYDLHDGVLVFGHGELIDQAHIGCIPQLLLRREFDLGFGEVVIRVDEGPKVAPAVHARPAGLGCVEATVGREETLIQFSKGVPEFVQQLRVVGVRAEVVPLLGVVFHVEEAAHDAAVEAPHMRHHLLLLVRPSEIVLHDVRVVLPRPVVVGLERTRTVGVKGPRVVRERLD
mmetsp:Transcript_16689/g.34870  ORF Transcript_16689/g.34870 Transcript_16689/m.34870 type:complete len:263 (+) Transcript_16689:516-1304(+)